MDIRGLKNYIYENKLVSQVLEAVGCHHIKYHISNNYWSCANPDGDNTGAVIVYNSPALNATDYTRTISKTKRNVDIIDFVF